MNNKPVDEEAYEQHVEKIEPELKKFEDLYLKQGGFIFGDEISIADLLGKIFLVNGYVWKCSEFEIDCSFD